MKLWKKDESRRESRRERRGYIQLFVTEPLYLELLSRSNPRPSFLQTDIRSQVPFEKGCELEPYYLSPHHAFTECLRCGRRETPLPGQKVVLQANENFRQHLNDPAGYVLSHLGVGLEG